MPKSVKQIIQANVRALLELEDGESGVSKLIRKGFANGTAQRILDAETSIGVNVLGELAEKLRVQPRQLCAPDLGRDPVLLKREAGRWPFADIPRDRWDALSERHKGAVEDAARQALERLEDARQKRTMTGAA